MWTPPIPADEQDRLADLRRLDLLLTVPEAPLDAVTRHLARVFDVPGAFISFIDEDTQYYKSEVGLPPEFADSRMEPREISLCSYVVGTNEPLVVEDLSEDERFRDSPAVHRFGVRFYAGAPLRGEQGHGIGSLCIVDQRPRTITRREQEMLSMLAEGVMAQVRLQVASRRLLDRSLEIERDLAQAVAVQRYLLPPARVDGGGWTLEHVYRPVAHLGGDFIDVQRRADGGWAALIADVTGHGTTAALTAAMIKTAFIRAIGATDSPADVLVRLDRELTPIAPPDQFITAQAIVLPPGGGPGRIASAGHPYPLLVGPDDVRTLETDNGPPLLLGAANDYRDVALDPPGPEGAVLLQTDGATEARDRAGADLGVAGLRRLAGALRGPDPAPLRALLDAIVAHAGGDPADDVALLLVRRSATAP